MSETLGGAGILGFGHYLPPQIRTNDFWNGRLAAPDEEQRKGDVLAVDRRADGQRVTVAPEILAAMAAMGNDPFRGARARHVLADDAAVSDMEAEACRRALRAAQVRPDEIDVVLVNSVLPDRIQPSNAPAIITKCELTRATGWALDVACASFQAAFVNAAALIRSGTYRYVLCVASYGASRFADYSSPTSTGLGDGAAAVVMGPVRAGQGLIGHWMRTDGAMRDGVVIVPVIDGRPQERWDLCSGPTRITSLNVDHGKAAGMNVTAACRESCGHALASAGCRLEDVAFFVSNQSLGWMVDACRRSLGLSAEQTIDTFAEIGNIGAAAIAFNLERAHQQGRLRDGDLVVTFSQGAGFTRAATVFRWVAPGR